MKLACWPASFLPSQPALAFPCPQIPASKRGGSKRTRPAVEMYIGAVIGRQAGNCSNGKGVVNLIFYRAL